MFEDLITREDVSQEAFLRQIEKGKPVSKNIIRRKMMREATVQLNYQETMDPEREEEIPDDRELSSAEEIRMWARELSQEVQSVINDFLHNPEERLLDTMEFLQRQGLIQILLEARPAPPVKKMNYTTMMKRALPATKDELIVMVTRAGTMERPAATVRAFLRRFSNNLTTDATGKFHWRN